MTIYTPREEHRILNCMHKTANSVECMGCVNRIGLHDIPMILNCGHSIEEPVITDYGEDD